MSDQPQHARAVDKSAEVDRATVEGDVPGRDGGPHDRDAMRAAEGLSVPSSVSEEYDDMVERGARQRGEGRSRVP